MSVLDRIAWGAVVWVFWLECLDFAVYFLLGSSCRLWLAWLVGISPLVRGGMGSIDGVSAVSGGAYQ
jgi:hypothetical protein